MSEATLIHAARRMLHQVRHVLAVSGQASPTHPIWGEIHAIEDEIAALSTRVMDAACRARARRDEPPPPPPVVQPEAPPAVARTHCPYCGEPVAVPIGRGRRPRVGHETCGRNACGFRQQRDRIMALDIDPLRWA